MSTEIKRVGFLENYNSKEGVIEQSNSRRIANEIIRVALFLSGIVIMSGIYIAIKESDSAILIAICASAGATFGTIGGAAMYFLFKQKQTESKEVKV